MIYMTTFPAPSRARSTWSQPHCRVDKRLRRGNFGLAEELPTIYGEEAAAVVVFVSAEYVARNWTRHERRAALARAVGERREYVLPARFDDTPLPGLLSDMVTVDLRGRTPQRFAAMIAAKLATIAIAVRDGGFGEPNGEPIEPGAR
jgi:hypothetical protein